MILKPLDKWAATTALFLLGLISAPAHAGYLIVDADEHPTASYFLGGPPDVLAYYNTQTGAELTSVPGPYHVQAAVVAGGASGQASALGFDSGSTAYANLATGVVAAVASSSSLSNTTPAFGSPTLPPEYLTPLNPDFGYASASAEINDTVTFSIPGATSSTDTEIPISVHLDGTIDPIAFAGDFYQLNIKDGSAQGAHLSWEAITTFTNPMYGAPNEGFSTVFGATPEGDWADYSIAQDSATDLTATMVLDLDGAHPTIDVDELMTAISYQGTADYLHTSYLSFVLPPGVTYTSGSGVFLTQSPAGVPEPGSWAVISLGALCLGGAARRRRQGRIQVTGVPQTAAAPIRG